MEFVKFTATAAVELLYQRAAMSPPCATIHHANSSVTNKNILVKTQTRSRSVQSICIALVLENGLATGGRFSVFLSGALRNDNIRICRENCIIFVLSNAFGHLQMLPDGD